MEEPMGDIYNKPYGGDCVGRAEAPSMLAGGAAQLLLSW
ncbi:Hypothetical protein A7982_01812 [Minicystis rosea]|nr:Hypothetical protein A7982_01812 [Minicystis rosea]